jgi:hypothetical protein
MMWGAAVYNLQLFLCKYVFLERRKGTLPLMRLRWLYQILTYFFFFFNVIFGFVMCVLRVFGMLVFTVVMLFRLDWDVYMRGLEGWDMGHRTYIAYIYMEYSYNNMILRLCAHLLLEAVHKRKSRLRTQLSSRLTENGTSMTSGPIDEMRSHRARLRWHLAFTLLRNQSLCQDRVSETQTCNHISTIDYGATYTIN